LLGSEPADGLSKPTLDLALKPLLVALERSHRFAGVVEHDEVARVPLTAVALGDEPHQRTLLLAAWIFSRYEPVIDADE
jgi:hypothetical protein